MSVKEILLKCRSCGHEWAPEKIDSRSLYFCPKCGMIGHLHEQFDLIK